MAGGPEYSGKPRPVLIVQDDAFAETASVTVCLLTSQALESPLIRIPIPAAPGTGLREPSWAMVDKITTVPRAKLRDRVGAVEPAAMTPIDRAILAFLGLA